MGCKSFLFVLLVAVALGFYWNLRGDVSGHVEVLLATQDLGMLVLNPFTESEPSAIRSRAAFIDWAIQAGSAARHSESDVLALINRHELRVLRLNESDIGVPVRIYYPHTRVPPPVLPIIVYYHGGGWVIGSSWAYHFITMHLCHEARAIVVSVDYRRAPEDKFPAAADDALYALRWVHENAASLGGDPARIMVAGDSAGGNLAAVTALQARDLPLEPPLLVQALIYPVTNYSFDTPTYARYGTRYGLDADWMRWFWSNYLNNATDGRDPRASPLQAVDLSRLPPALVIQAECDVLRSEGEAYVARLKDAGVKVKVQRYDRTYHGFLSQVGVLPEAIDAMQTIGAFLRAYDSSPVPPVPK